MEGYWTLKIRRAIVMAADAHKEQKRKEKNIPFISHPLAVGILLSLLHCEQDVIIAGILHDTLEDTRLKAEAIGDAFGANVFRIVLACTEMDKSLEWEDRKIHTIENLYNADLQVKLVTCADKLDNLQSINDELLSEGCNNPNSTKTANVWLNFKRGYESQKWFYQSVVRALFFGIEKIPNPPNIFGTLMRLAENVFGERIIDDETVRAKVPSRH